MSYPDSITTNSNYSSDICYEESQRLIMAVTKYTLLLRGSGESSENKGKNGDASDDGGISKEEIEMFVQMSIEPAFTNYVVAAINYLNGMIPAVAERQRKEMVENMSHCYEKLKGAKDSQSRIKQAGVMINAIQSLRLFKDDKDAAFAYIQPTTSMISDALNELRNDDDVSNKKAKQELEKLIMQAAVVVGFVLRPLNKPISNTIIINNNNNSNSSSSSSTSTSPPTTATTTDENSNRNNEMTQTLSKLISQIEILSEHIDNTVVELYEDERLSKSSKKSITSSLTTILTTMLSQPSLYHQITPLLLKCQESIKSL